LLLDAKVIDDGVAGKRDRKLAVAPRAMLRVAL